MAANKGTVSAFRFADVIVRQSFACLFAISLVLVCTGDSCAQRPLFGVSVQLPTIRNFSVSTNVSVPDGGTISLGGVSRSAEGRVSSGVPGLPFRPFRNSATGRESSVSRATATAKIISLKEMEEDLLAGGNRRQRMLQDAKDALAGKKPMSKLDGSDSRSLDQQVADWKSRHRERVIRPGERERKVSRPVDETLQLVRASDEVESFADFLAANIGRGSGHR